MGELLDEFIEMGIRGLWPQLNLYDKDESFTLKCRMNKIAIYIHPDRQRLIPLGTPLQIDSYIRLAAEKYKNQGRGGFFMLKLGKAVQFEKVYVLRKKFKYKNNDY